MTPSAAVRSVRSVAARAPGRWRAAVVAGLAALLLGAGCAQAPKAIVLADELPFDAAVAAVTEGMAAQVRKLPRPANSARRGVVVDPMLDAASGQQTAATQLLQSKVALLMATQGDLFDLLPFQAGNLAGARFLLLGTMARGPADRPDAVRRLNLAVVDLGDGRVVAQATALSRAGDLDHLPQPYHRDSPVLVKDDIVDGYIRTAATAPGQPADRVYLGRLGVAPLINEATALYDTDRPAEALAQYRAALAMPGGEQLRALTGVYLSLVKLGRGDEAEAAFGSIVAHGIATDQLRVRFLFNPGATTFWSDPRVSDIYPMWLRQIAAQAERAGACMDIVGHTSRTGPEAYNDELSRRRADAIRDRLDALAPRVAARARTAGRGWRDNIVGSGTDDAVDSLDRRVEFKVVACR